MGGIDVTLDRLSSRVLDKSSLTIESIATKGEASVRPSCNHAGIPASGDPKPMAKPHESGGMEWLSPEQCSNACCSLFMSLLFLYRVH
jgi:hypothetical protein